MIGLVFGEKQVKQSIYHHDSGKVNLRLDAFAISPRKFPLLMSGIGVPLIAGIFRLMITGWRKN